MRGIQGQALAIDNLAEREVSLSRRHEDTENRANRLSALCASVAL